jgi:hypothetical protein
LIEWNLAGETVPEVIMKRLIGIVITLCLLHPFLGNASNTPVGNVKMLKGKASIIRNRSVLEAKEGSDLFQDDSLKTASESSLSIVFKDDTLISIGPNSELAINEFHFSPAEGKLSIVTRLLRGTSAYVSGIIGKLSPQSVRFETPVANIGIRGTKFAVKIEGDDEESR